MQGLQLLCIVTPVLVTDGKTELRKAGSSPLAKNAKAKAFLESFLRWSYIGGGGQYLEESTTQAPPTGNAGGCTNPCPLPEISRQTHA